MDETKLENLELQMLVNNKQAGFNYRERREEDWKENYELYRDKVTINRLTQRQSVNLPLMKTSLRTILKDVDDMPVIEFENLDNDKEAQVLLNETWKEMLDKNNAKLQDIVDKKQDFFFGRTFDSWQIIDGKVVFDIEDPEDILVDRFMSPYNLHSSAFLIHTHIYKPLSTLVDNKDYDQKEVKKLIKFFESKLGIIKAQDNENSLQLKNQKMADMGVPDMDDPVLGETYVELTVHYVFRSNEKDEQGNKLPRQIFVYHEAENQCILMKKPQEEIIGVTSDHYWRDHYRYNTWGDDIDKQDFWTDSIADIIRVPNKVLNSWFSQLVENRTLRNFGMHYYNAGLQANGFTPSSIQPAPFAFIPIPVPEGQRLQDVFQKVDIPDLSDSIDEMHYVTQFSEKATGATTTSQGAINDKQTTLGEVDKALVESKERAGGISKFNTIVWEQRGLTYLKLVEANKDKIDAVKIYTKGKNSDNFFPREVEPKHYLTKSGFKVKVWSQVEKEANDTKALTKLQLLKVAMPDNPVVAKIYNRTLAEYAKATPEEIKEIMDYEKQKMAMPMMGGTMGGQQAPMPQIGSPAAPLLSQ